jgi:nucleotide-binding universal stress UspA family protein
MVSIKKILAPVDGSEYMKEELELACDVARTFGAELTIFHVIAMPISAEISGMPVAATEMEEAGRQVIESAKKVAEGCGVTPKYVRRAVSDGTDLIIIGAKGKNRLREILMGSVANSVVNNAHCMVLVIH